MHLLFSRPCSGFATDPERLLPEPGGRIVNRPVQPFVARTRLKGTGNPDAGPALRRQVLNAVRISLAKPWRRVELKGERIVGSMTPGQKAEQGSCSAFSSMGHQHR
jgi:hypothetical protein